MSVQARSEGLDAARALAALAVMASHLRNALLPEFDALAQPGLLLKAFYAATGFGHQAVIVFFVLSGYFVGGSVIQAGSRFDAAGYAAARIARLWTVLIPALVLTAMCDGLLLAAVPDAFDATQAARTHSLPRPGDYSASLTTALGNLLFLQTVAVPTFGSNGALWSLANEAWYYLIFPCLWCGLVTGKGPWPRALALAATLGLLLAMPAPMRGLLPVWLMGAALHRLPTPRLLAGRMAGVLTLALFSGVLVLARGGRLFDAGSVWPDLLLGAAFAAWCAHVRATDPTQWPRPLAAAAAGLADLSYSLYAMHMPLVFLSVGLLWPGGMRAADAAGLAAFAVLFIALLLAAALAWWAFERHTPRLRRWLTARLQSARMAAFRLLASWLAR